MEASGKAGDSAADDGDALHEGGLRGLSRNCEVCDSRPRDLGQRLGQPGGIIKRLCAPQAQAFFFGKLPESDVDVVKNLDMIAEKAYRLDEYTRCVLGLESQDR